MLHSRQSQHPNSPPGYNTAPNAHDYAEYQGGNRWLVGIDIYDDVPVCGGGYPSVGNLYPLVFGDQRNRREPLVYIPEEFGRLYPTIARALLPLLTNWRRLGGAQNFRFHQAGKDANDESQIDIFNKSAEAAIAGSIVRVKNAEIIYADGQIVKTLDTSDDTTEVADVGGQIVGLDIGEITGDTTALVYTEAVVSVPLGCAEAAEAGRAYGLSIAESQFFLYSAGALDCQDGFGYAWDDFLYEQDIRAGEDHADGESYIYYWTIPGDITFTDPSDADCWRDAFIEALRETYDQGSTDEGCGSGGGGEP